MVRSAQNLESIFRKVGITRRGRTEYTNDDGYWTGGNCNWGGYHSLGEDCQTIASGLNKVESLNGKTITNELTKATSEQEFNSKKSTLLMKCDEALRGLRIKTGASSSMFGVCCIWGQQDNNKLIEKELDYGRTEITNIKKLVERTNYNWAEEIKDLTAEIRKIEMGMEEKKKRALDPNLSPQEKLAILEEIESNGKLLQSKLQERNELTGRFKHIDPSKYVSGLIDKMEQAIKGSMNNSGGGGSGGDGSGGNRNKNKDKNSSGGNGGGGGSGDNDDKDPKPPRGKKEEKKEKDNSQMLLIIVAVIVIFFLMSQKDNHSSHRRDYDEFDYY